MKRVILMCLLIFILLNLYAQGKYVTYMVDSVEYKGYFIGSQRTSNLVIIVHDWDGLTDYEIKRAEMLYKQGYSVFALDLFGKGVKADTIDKRRKLTGALYSDRNKMRKLLLAGVKTAEKQGSKANKVVAAGYCFGGAAVLELARSGTQLQGFVSFHGGLTTPEGQDYTKTKGKVYIFHGTADSSVSMDDFAGLAKELEETKINHEMITYSGAPHAFTVFGSSRYRADADQKSWNRFLEILKEI